MTTANESSHPGYYTQDDFYENFRLYRDAVTTPEESAAWGRERAEWVILHFAGKYQPALEAAYRQERFEDALGWLAEHYDHPLLRKAGGVLETAPPGTISGHVPALLYAVFVGAHAEGLHAPPIEGMAEFLAEIHRAVQNQEI